MPYLSFGTSILRFAALKRGVQLFGTIVGQGRDGFINSSVSAYDCAITEVVVIPNDSLQNLEILADHFCDIFEGAEIGHGGHSVASGFGRFLASGFRATVHQGGGLYGHVCSPEHLRGFG